MRCLSGSCGRFLSNQGADRDNLLISMSATGVNLVRWNIIMLKINLIRKNLLILCSCSIFLVGCNGEPNNSNPSTGNGDDTSSSIKFGSSAGSSFTEGELTASLNEGTTSWTVSATVVDQNNSPVNTDYEVSFSSSCVDAGLSSFSNETVTTVAGRASTVYSSESCSGVDVISASMMTAEGTTLTGNVDIDIESASDDENPVGTPQMGIGTGADFVAGSLGAATTSLAAGGNSTLSVNIVNADGDLVTEPVSITFNSACVANSLSNFTPESSVSTSTGFASIRYNANGCSGTDTVTATASVNGVSLAASVELTIASDQVLGITFMGADPSQLALSGTGGEETTLVTFRLLGALGAPIVGESVSFSLSTGVGGIRLAPGTETALSDSNGEVSTVLQSGTVSTSVNVTATHDATGIQSFSDGIIISSGVPVQSKFSLSVEDFFPPSAFDTDGIEVNINVIASDFFGNNAVDGTQVFFASPESGNIGSSCLISDGACSVTWRSAGDRPDNLRAGIIAYTTGAEDYTDNNGNNVYDGDDTFNTVNDLGEPYLDENENGVYDQGEFFVNTDNDTPGARDEANGLWDGPCLLAINPSADCSGEDSVTVYKTAIIRMPTNTPRLLASEVSYDLGATWTDMAPGGTINTSNSPSGVAQLRLLVGDSNTLADDFGGHPLPTGTNINTTTNITGGGFDIAGDTSVDVRNNSSNAAPTMINITITDTAVGIDQTAVMTTSVEPPDTTETKYTWTVNYNN